MIMKESLQELVNLYMHKDNDIPKCHVHFKGRLESYDIVNVDELLFDILCLCKNKLSNTEGKLKYLDVAKVIADCYEFEEVNYTDFEIVDGLDGRTDFAYNMKSILNETIELLDYLDSINGKITANVLNAFLCKYHRYVPLYDKRVMSLDKYETPEFEEEMCLTFLNDNVELLDLIRLKSQDKEIYNYECDVMPEIIIALLHYLSMNNYNIKKCKNCGRYFVAFKRSDEEYCSRIYKENINCKTYHRHQLRKARLINNDVLKKYNSVYTNISNRMNAKKHEFDFEELFDLREKLVNEYQVYKNYYSDEEMINWLDSFLVKNQK